MKSLRYSEISESEESDEAPGSKSSSAKAPIVNNKPSNSSSSESSSDSEEAPKRSSTLLNQTPPTKSPKKTVSLRPIERFTEQNPGLTPVHVDNIISEDDDVCFLEIPKTIDPGQFLGKVINFDRRTKLKIDKTRYVIELNEETVKPLTILTNKLKVIRPVANLQLREYTKRKSDGGSVESEKFTPVLPDNLKVRHPLFGAKYENKIVLDEEIQQKLDNTIEQFVKKMKKKKKHKERVEEEAEPEQKESIFTLLESHSMGQKKRKKKKHKEEANERNGELTQTSLGEGGDSDTTQSFKKKQHKKKKKKEAEEVYKEEYNAPVSSFNTTHESLSALTGEGESFKKKHKKKKRTEDEEGEKSKGTQKTNLVNSTIIPGLQLPSFSFDISSIMNKEERGGKIDNADESGDEFKSDGDVSKRNKSFEFSGDTSDIRKKKKKRDKCEDDVEVSPKKKHKRDKEATNSLISDILSRVKSEMDTSVAKHKKKKKSDR